MTGEQRSQSEPGDALPSEARWLDAAAELPAGALPTAEFATKVLAALAEERRQAPWTRAELETFAPPAPNAEFAARTTAKVLAERRERWRTALLRHDTPEPSPEFVARTLRALAADREVPTAPTRRAVPDARRRPSPWLLTTAAAAAALLVWSRIGSTDSPAPPALQARSAAFAHAHTTSTLPELMVRLEAEFDPMALPAVAADGAWLAEARRLAEAGR